MTCGDGRSCTLTCVVDDLVELGTTGPIGLSRGLSADSRRSLEQVGLT
jgi:hypothetical protein